MKKVTAVVYSEGFFTQMDGKTANGLVRHSEQYEIVAVIDSQFAGEDSGIVLDGVANGISIFKNLDDALSSLSKKPQTFIYGIAPSSGDFSEGDISLMEQAMAEELNIVSGMHRFLSDDEAFMQKATLYDVTVTDVRKYEGKNLRRLFTGEILKVTAPRIAVLGTDGAIGKRTTATIIAQALNDAGYKAVMISTGQTGLMQGAKYGAPLDAIQGHFAAGVVEGEILRAWDAEQPDIFIIEGQGALTHPAYLSSCAISRGSQANGVILQHAPMRSRMGDYPDFAIPKLEDAIKLNEMFTSAPVVAITINHEDMDDAMIDKAIEEYKKSYKRVVTDVLKRDTQCIIDAIETEFPELLKKKNA